MAIRFAPDSMAEVAAEASRSDKDYIRRYADWVRHALDSQATLGNGG